MRRHRESKSSGVVLEERADVLDKARLSAEPEALPMAAALWYHLDVLREGVLMIHVDRYVVANQVVAGAVLAFVFGLYFLLWNRFGRRGRLVMSGVILAVVAVVYEFNL
jgi:hypothetical protein